MALSITGGSGGPASQANTQSPQISAGSGSPTSASAGSVQPGTATSVLTSEQGIGLKGTQLSVVSFSNAPKTITGQTQASDTKASKHHINAVGIGVIAVVVLAALIIFWQINRSAKNTTY